MDPGINVQFARKAHTKVHPIPAKIALQAVKLALVLAIVLYANLDIFLSKIPALSVILSVLNV